MANQVVMPAQGWVPRWYQLEYWKFRRAGGRRAVLVLPRRHGKDHLCINDMAYSACIERVGAYYYIMPFQNQARRVVWNGIDKDGKRFIDAFPPQMIEKKIDAEMRIHLRNGSIFQLVGGDDPDKLVGANPVGVVYSEYALTDPRAWQLVAPILTENEGWATFNSTPRGKNHFWRMLNNAKQQPDRWFWQHECARSLKVLSAEQLRELRDELGDEALFQQEAFCSFDSPLQGAYYAVQFNMLDKKERITTVPVDSRLPVHTAWDLGINDEMSIWFFQTLRREIRLVHYYENNGEGLPHYANYLQSWASRNLVSFGEHHAPHDIMARELTTGRTRLETARSLGIRFRPAAKMGLSDGIEAVRNILPNCWFDANETARGVDCLRNYQKKWDATNMRFANQPLHNWASHGADAFRTLAAGLRRNYDSMDEVTERNPIEYNSGDDDYF